MKENEINETLSIVLSYVKGIDSYLKNNKRRHSEGDSGEEGDYKIVEMLQGIADVVSRIEPSKSFTKEQSETLERITNSLANYLKKICDENQSELKSLLEVISEKLSELPESILTLPTAAPQKTTKRNEHYFTVDFKNSKAALTMIAMGLALLISGFLNFRQLEKNDDLRDNDLKYRYIRMQCKATPEELLRLENVFGFNRNNDSVKLLQRQVEQYEKLLQEYNDKQLQIRLNNARASQIEQEAETVKGKK